MFLASIALLLLFGLVLLGMPIVLATAASAITYILLSGGWTMAFPQQIIAGMNGFILLALPLFIFAGSLMNASGMSARIFEFAKSLVGGMRGGLAHVNITTSMFFGGLIGTSVADIAGTGSVVIPEMKRNDYPADFSAALTASSSGIGPMIPPSSPMILYAAVTGTSLGTLFLAGIIPGVLLGLTLMVIVGLLARRHGWGSMSKRSVQEIVRTGKVATLAFGMPVIVVGGLVFGVFTPTEAGSFAVVYAFIVAWLIYRSVTLRQLYRVAVNATALTGEVMLIVGVSVALGTALARARVPDRLAVLVDIVAIGDVRFFQILALVLVAIIAGMILDPLIPIVMPILLPALIVFDIDPVHFGILMVMTVVIGQVTPPLAMSLVVAGKIGEVDLWDVLRANLPFLIGMVVFLLLLIAFPQLSLWLPGLLR